MKCSPIFLTESDDSAGRLLMKFAAVIGYVDLLDPPVSDDCFHNGKTGILFRSLKMGIVKVRIRAFLRVSSKSSPLKSFCSRVTKASPAKTMFDCVEGERYF
jgi:hypothetical protein